MVEKIRVCDPRNANVSHVCGIIEGVLDDYLAGHTIKEIEARWGICPGMLEGLRKLKRMTTTVEEKLQQGLKKWAARRFVELFSVKMPALPLLSPTPKKTTMP